MAKIIDNSSKDLKSEYEKYSNDSKKYLILTVICFILFLPTAGLTLIPFGICSYLWTKNSKKAKILFSGLEGEIKSSGMLEKLPDSYYVLPDVLLEVDGATSQMDHIVIGTNGIFVIETKNHNGFIEGVESDREFTQHKVGRKGGEYSKTFYSPVKQVNTHVFRVSEFLKSHGHRDWVQGMVLFTNPQADVNVASQKTPVFNAKEAGTKEILNYIMNYEAKRTIDSERCREMAKLIANANKKRTENSEYIEMLEKLPVSDTH